MNKRLFIFIGAIIICFGFIFNAQTAHAATLDHIYDYEVVVDMRDDGSCDISYHIKWQVLDSTSEGPLTWIKVGIANRFADEFKALSDNIDDIYYYKDDGDFVRLDLDREYEAGEVLNLDFSLHQKNLVKIEGDEAVYWFTPGWFEETPVDKIVIRWNAENVLYTSGVDHFEDGYYVWINDKGGYDLHATSYVSYNASQYDSSAGNVETREIAGTLYSVSELETLTMLLVFVPLGLLILLFIIFRKKIFKDDSYSKERGLGGRYYAHTARGHYGGGGGGCACACACACAGGGRAGCSRKDFYGTKLYTRDIYKALA